MGGGGSSEARETRAWTEPAEEEEEGREQTGLIQKARSEIYLMLFSQKLRKQWLDTHFS